MSPSRIRSYAATCVATITSLVRPNGVTEPLSYEMTPEEYKAVSEVLSTGYGFIGSRGDLWSPWVRTFRAAGLRLYSKDEELLDGSEDRSEQPDFVYLRGSGKEFIIPTMRGRDALDWATGEENGIYAVAPAFDIVLNSTNKRIVKKALDDSKLRLPFNHENREAIRDAMERYIEDAGFRVLAFTGKPTGIYPIFQAESGITSIGGLSGRKVLAEEKGSKIARALLELYGLNADDLLVQEGGAETAVSMRLVDGSLVVSRTGETIKEHDVVPGEKIINSESCLVSPLGAYERETKLLDGFGEIMSRGSERLMEHDPEFFSLEEAEEAIDRLRGSRSAEELYGEPLPVR